MKKLLMLTLITLISFNASLMAQSENGRIDEKLNLNLESFTIKYNIEVKAEGQFNFDIRSKIKDGTLTINIYTPDGEKDHCIVLDASIGHSTAKGSISESLDNPFAGTWVVEVISDRALGDLRINAKQ